MIPSDVPAPSSVRRFVDDAPSVYNIGAANLQRTWSIEAAVPIATFVAALDALITLLVDIDGAGFATAPLGVRFCRGTPHPLSLVHGTPDEVFGIVEISTFLDKYETKNKKPDGNDRVFRGRDLIEACGELLVTEFGARLHFGQSIPKKMTAAEVMAPYQSPESSAMRDALDARDPGRVFASDVAIAMGIRTKGP